MYKIVFFDIDGTLVTTDQTIPESTLKSLKLLHEKGIKLVIATGRPFNHIESFKQLLPVDMDAWILINGQYCISNETCLYSQTMSEEEFREAYDFLNTHHIGTFIVEERNMFVNEGYDRNDKHFLKEYRNEPLYDIQRLDTYPIYQMMAHIHEKDKELEEEFFSIMKSCKGARWNQYSTDIIPKDGGKQIGISKVLDFFHISKEEAIAFGDGDNDKEMLEYVGLGIAMGNSIESVKEIADHITDDINEDGIYNALKKYLII